MTEPGITEFPMAPDQACLSCGHTFELTANMKDDSAPKPGDWTLCIECADPHVFVESPMGLTVRWPSPEEWRVLSQRHLADVRLHQQAIHEIHRRGQAKR